MKKIIHGYRGKNTLKFQQKEEITVAEGRTLESVLFEAIGKLIHSLGGATQSHWYITDQFYWVYDFDGGVHQFAITAVESIDKASKALTDEFIRSLKEGDGWLKESDEGVNNASRDIVLAYHKHFGEAWIGNVNNKDRLLVKYNPDEPLGSFGGGFVAPCYDEELVRLMRERLEAPYTGTDDDRKRIDAIHERRDAIGARSLFWS